MIFTSMDVETANPDLASICQIGLVTFRDGAITERLYSSTLKPMSRMILRSRGRTMSWLP